MLRMNTAKPRSTRKPVENGPVTDALRQAMKDTGLSAYRLAADSGVNVAAILRFMGGKRSMNLQSADRLAAALGLELVAKK
jgi:transcriptional regulator with XRE-family HTH domain